MKTFGYREDLEKNISKITVEKHLTTINSILKSLEIEDLIIAKTNSKYLCGKQFGYLKFDNKEDTIEAGQMTNKKSLWMCQCFKRNLFKVRR